MSFVIPVLNDADQLRAVLDSLQKRFSETIEILIVDGGSIDNSRELAKEYACTLLSSSPGRAQQMNVGAAAAQGDWLCFLHADTLPPDSIEAQLAGLRASRREWGFFPVRIMHPRVVYRVIEWFMCQRSRLTSIATGDQLLCVRRSKFDALRGYADIPLMEDIDLSKRLKRTGPPWLAGACVGTSARRWQEHGVLKTVGLMWCLRLAYFFGVRAETLHGFYYPGIKTK